MSSAIGWMGVAVVGSAVVGGGASAYSANKSSNAIKSASNATSKTTADTNAMLQAQYDQTREDNEPWRLAGEQALSAIQNTPDFEFTAESFNFLKDPSYDFRMQEGVDALDRSAASRGRLLSGGQDRAVTRYASDLASQEYNNAFNRHQSSEAQRFGQEKSTFDTNLNTDKSLAGVGQQAVNATANAGTSATNAMANVATAGTASQNALAIQGVQTQGQMATNIATSANQGMGNYLLYKNS